jgi:small subunit ribosomal protein S20
MPIIKSAKKRVKVANKAAIRNSKTKRSLKGALKAFQKAVTGGAKEAKATQSKAQSAIDTAAKKGVMHKNKAARKASQVAKAAKAAAGAEAKAVKKPAAKKAAPAKKATVAKKPAAKKPAAKKTTK